MDILVSSNFERLLWYLAYDADTGLVEDDKILTASENVDGWMKMVKDNGRVQVPIKVLELARRDFMAERISDEQTLQTIRFYFEAQPSYIADPHTAVGLSAARLLADEVAASSSAIQIALSTAHPAKFSDAVAQALHSHANFDFERDVLPKEFKGLLDKEKRVIDVSAPEVVLVKRVIEEHIDAGGSV